MSVVPRRPLLAALLASISLCCTAAAPGAPVCAGGAQPAWRDFYCRFMTVERWEAAGRPDFTAPDGTRWQPWFYGDRSTRGNNLLYEGQPYVAGRAGLLEALLKVGMLPDEYDPAYVARFWDLFRYAPWSVYVARKLGCRDGQAADPRALAETRAVPRAALLGLGDAAFARDRHDPTGGMGPGALAALIHAAGLDAAPPAAGAACRPPPPAAR